MIDYLKAVALGAGIIVVVILLAYVAAGRPANQKCERVLAATETEREVLLVVTANPDCARLVTDSLLAARQPAQEEPAR